MRTLRLSACIAFFGLALLTGCQTRPPPVTAYEIDITIEGAPTLRVQGADVVYLGKTYTPEEWDALRSLLIADLKATQPPHHVALQIPRGQDFWTFYEWIARLRTLPVKRVFLTGPE